ncbi:MAG TPA: hypothetical protein VGO14_01060 [Solirubrobacteraceae bacterium]|nr:hypothetical protein [Solirubrobacteraceae bacterium]
MPDFDANEDHPILPGTGQEQPAESADQGVPVVPRAREDAGRHRDRRAPGSRRRLGRPLRTQRRRAGLRACDLAGRGCMLRSLPRRRRLWTECHRRPPGSPS